MDCGIDTILLYGYVLIILSPASLFHHSKNKGPNVTIGTTDPSGVTLNMSFSRAGSKIKAESKS